MTDPKRFRQASGQSLEGLLFDSASDDAPSPQARGKLLSALATGSAGTLAASQAAAATGKAATTLGASSAASILVKSVVIGALATGAVVAVKTIAQPPRHASPPASAAPHQQPVAHGDPPTDRSLPQTLPSALAAKDPAPREASHEPKPAPVKVDDVTAQRELLDQARNALNASRASLALKATNQYESQYGFGLLGHEETVLSIEALLALGRRDAADKRAREYLSRYPQGTQVSTVTRLMQVAAPPASGTAPPSNGAGEENPSRE